MKKFLIAALFALCSITYIFAADDDVKTGTTTVKLFGNASVAMSDKNYMVTPGDVYSLVYNAGSSAVNISINVDASYRIRISNLAIIDARGKTYVELKKQVEDIVLKNYPLSGVSFTLKTPSIFLIQINGVVKESKEIPAWALSRLSSLVSEHTTSYSSTRDVQITSADGKTRTYDLFKATRFGDLSQDPYVRPGDIITVSHIDRVVTISGSVERTGKYQLLPGENLRELIYYYAEGFTASANVKRIEVSRVKTETSISGEKFYVSAMLDDDTFELMNSDSVKVFSYSELKPVMFMEGAVGSLSSGSSLNTSAHMPVQFERSTNYAYFIRNNSKLFKSSVSDNDNAYIVRGEETIPLNINSVLYDLEFSTELLVQENDILVVPFKQYFVSISGAVRAPGRYPYIPNRTWDYYVNLAGGFTPQQNAFDAIEITDMDGHKHSKAEVITPEMRIHAKSNHITYVLNQYGTLISLIASLITSVLSLYTLLGKLV